jgi:hypothetical protein
VKDFVCVYHPGDPECDGTPTHFLRTKQRHLLKPLCKVCAQSFENQELTDDITDDLINEYVCQEIMES